MDSSDFSNLQEQLPSILFREAAAFQGLHSGFHPDNLKAGLMALPKSTSEVSAMLSSCNKFGITVVPQGGRTGLAGAASSHSNQLIVDTAMMNRIVQIDKVGGNATVECGVTLAALESEVNQLGLTCGIDLSARDSATIGGMVATNAGGIEAFRNGVMRHRVLGLEAVLADGRVLSDLKRVTKANEGYDVKQLFIGAEGTLGIVTQVVLSLLPLQTGSVTALTSCETTEQAVALFRFLHNQPDVNLLSAEVMWPDYAWTVAKATEHESVLAFDTENNSLFVLLEAASSTSDQQEAFEAVLMDLIEQNNITNAVIAKNQKERNEMWRIREDSFTVDDVNPHGLWFDVSVPLDEMPLYAKQVFKRIASISKDLKLFLFAHLGDGNFHATVSAGYPIPELEDAVCSAMYQGLSEMGGSFSAEHGIGIEKKKPLQHQVDGENLEVMRQLKQMLDPNGIMNPNKVI